MKIIIPTYHRVTHQRTLGTLGPKFKKQATLVVRPDEEAAIRAMHPETEVEVLPPTIEDLPATRQWIWERYGHERFVMCDDDISMFSRKWDDPDRKMTGARYPQRTIRGNDVAQQEMFDALEAELIAGAGMAGPTACYMPPVEGLPPIRAGRVIQFVMLNGPLLQPLGLRWDRLHWVEDGDFVLQVLSHGIETVLLRTFAYEVETFGTVPGGLNAPGMTHEHRRAHEAEAFVRLAGLHPGYVKQLSGGKWRISWKKLFTDRPMASKAV